MLFIITLRLILLTLPLTRALMLLRYAVTALFSDAI